jgi:DivIVA domain-containing protein
MPLDRPTIEKRDFPINRRGYDPEAVDAHLAALADEVEVLQRASRRRSGDSLAAAASAQVQAIVEAAETSAAEIEREAQEEAAETRAQAAQEAQRVRDDAVQRAREHVGRVHQATQLMLQRVDAMEGELGALVEALRTGGNRLSADLSLLEGGVGDLYDALGQERPRSAPQRGEQPDDVLSAAAVAGRPEPQPGPAQPQPAGAEDVEGARLVALNMALDGRPREDADRYLAEHYALDDREGLLDEVYASVARQGA